MKLFKHKHCWPDHSGHDKTAGWIARGILSMQKAWAERMTRFMERLSPASRKVVLVGSGLLMAVYSLTLVVFSLKKAGANFARPIAISIPLSIVKHAPVMPPVVPPFIKRIENFKMYLDSLSKTAEGQRVRDSLLQRRPGLLDSIQRIETIYCSK